MKIYLGADHAGFELKEQIKLYLQEKGHEVEDCGAFIFDQTDDYPDFISKAAIGVAKDPNFRGFVFGKSGAGECIVANKIRNIRAILGVNIALMFLILFATIHSPAPDFPKTNPLKLGSFATPIAAFEIKSG